MARRERFWTEKRKKQERVLTARGIRGSERECVCDRRKENQQRGVS